MTRRSNKFIQYLEKESIGPGSCTVEISKFGKVTRILVTNGIDVIYGRELHFKCMLHGHGRLETKKVNIFVQKKSFDYFGTCKEPSLGRHM